MAVGPVALASTAFVALDAAPPHDELVRSLMREGITVLEATLDEPPVAQLVLAWMASPIADDGLEALVAWRDRADGSPILLGCAPLGNAADAERALAAGFDDFVAGRSSAREIAARVRALHRRIRTVSGPDRGRLRLGRVTIDPARHELWLGNRRVALTAMELALMTRLMAARGAVLGRVELLDQVWGADNLDVGLRAVDNLILRLRRKLGEGVIVTVRGSGFRLAED